MKCDIKIINRIKRTKGQINGVLNMIDEQRSCDDLTIQLKAIEKSINKTITLLTIENLKQKALEKYQVDLSELEDELNLILNR